LQLSQDDAFQDTPFLKDLKSIQVTVNANEGVNLCLLETVTPSVHFVINNELYHVLCDSGCRPVSCIDADTARELNLEIIPQQGTVKFGNNSETARIGHTSLLKFDLVFTGLKNPLPPRTISHSFEVVQGLSSKKDPISFILGTDLMTIYCESIEKKQASDFVSALLGLELSFNNPVPSTTSLKQFSDKSSEGTTISVMRLITENPELGEDDLSPMKPRITSSEDEYKLYRVDKESILNDPQIQNEWNYNESITGGVTHPEAVVKLNFKQGIDLQSLSRHQYPVPQRAIAFVDQAVETWHQQGKDEIVTTNPGLIINVPLLAVPKISGGMVIADAARVCCDPRIPNEALDYVDDFQMPLIRKQLESYGGKQLFAEFDLENCFFQCPIHPETRYLAYTWRGIQYRFTHTPFGIKFITSHVQRLMSKIFADMNFVFVYVDNIFIASSSWKEHQGHILLVLQRCNKYHIKLKRKAFKLGETKMYSLGHIVSRDGISTDPNKVKSILEWPAPGTGEGLQSFLGLTGYVRMFVRHYSELAAPLEAIKYHKTITWNDNLLEHFLALKKAVSLAPFLAYPDFSRPFYVQTDGSNFGCGAVLYQPKPGYDEITSDNIVALASKQFTDSQRNYSAYKKELFGIVYALRQFHSYLAFRTDNHLFTDHKPLTFMFSSDNLSPALQMWLDILLSYNFTVHHRPGFLNVLPDALSRMYTTKYAGKPWGVPANIRFADPVIIEQDTSSAETIQVRPIVVDSSSEEKDPLEDNLKLKLMAQMELKGKTIPASEEDRIKLIQQEHSLGHFGRDAIFNALMDEDYWWPGMRQQIQTVISQCDSCARFVIGKVGFKPSSFILSQGPWSHIQMDCCLSFPKAYDGNSDLLVIIDLFTSFVIAFPIKDRSAKSVAQKLWHVCSLFGLPSILQSDNGKEFCNSVLKEMVKIMQLDLRYIAPYNPRCDGAVERAVGVISTTIRKLLQGADIYWPLFVPVAQMYINNKVHSVTKSTPFSLMFGRPFNLPRINSESSDKSTEQMTQQEWTEFQSRMNTVIYPEIFKKLKLNKEKMVQSVDQRHRLLANQDFPIGSKVMLKDPRKKDKRDANYVGPYTIQQKDQNGNCVLMDNDGVSLARHVPPDQLKFMSLPTSSNLLELSDNIRTIKSILDHKGDPGIAFGYLVSWADGTESWEPATEFYDTECIRTYWRTRSQKLRKQNRYSQKQSKSTNKKHKSTLDVISDELSDFVGVEVKDSNSHYNSNLNLNSKSDSILADGIPSNLQSEQSQLQSFVDKFIQHFHLTSRKLQLRKNALDHQLENQMTKANLRFTFGDVVHRLRKTLRERFPE